MRTQTHAPTMKLAIGKSFILMFLCTHACATLNLTYSDLEAEGVACPVRDRCEGYVRSNQEYMDSSCECDFSCSYYKDCCIDATLQNSAGAPPRNSIKCMNYGEDRHSGVYAISSCRPRWNGAREVRNKCTGPMDFSDPLASAPVTDVALKVTYRNLYCAECNKAKMDTLQTFQIRMSCDGLQHLGLTDEQILADIEYNQRLKSWGVNRLNSHGNETIFYGCGIIYDVPSYLNTNVRFCRSNIISRCASNWTRPVVKKKCDRYMAVVYDNNDAYRNPHCALCNYRTAEDISCLIGVHSRKRPMSFALLLDINPSDGDKVGMKRVPTPECPSGYKYDPYFKKCRLLVCALPGHVVVNGKCVKS